MPAHDPLTVFKASRPRLLGLAYRILGSHADAEDAVQDTFLNWVKADRQEIQNPASWLTTSCTRRCLDLLRAAYRSRVDYVGAWLPDPIHTPVEDDTEARLELASSLTTAFLLLLERLTPRERAAYLLHEIFDLSYAEVAQILEIQEAACRKLVSRAKAGVGRAKHRQRTPLARQDQLLGAFRDAVTDGRTDRLSALLSEDIRLSADGGGKVPAIREVLKGRAEVMAFLAGDLQDYWAGRTWIAADLNGARGVLIKQDDAIEAAVSFAYDDAGRVTDIFIVRNPDKLAGLGAVAIH